VGSRVRYNSFPTILQHKDLLACIIHHPHHYIYPTNDETTCVIHSIAHCYTRKLSTCAHVVLLKWQRANAVSVIAATKLIPSKKDEVLDYDGEQCVSIVSMRLIECLCAVGIGWLAGRYEVSRFFFTSRWWFLILLLTLDSSALGSLGKLGK